ncbi:MAG: hypothetical protein ACREQ4_09535 [Candidatus Binataceae bacterium]
MKARKAKSKSSGKVFENRLRRTLERRGFQLMKSRARDPYSVTYGGYQIVDPDTNTMVAGSGDAQRGYGLSLEEVAEWVRDMEKGDA